jgi:hypothetical protein
MFDSGDAPRRAPKLLTLLELAEGTGLPQWGPSVGNDIQIDEPAGNVELGTPRLHATVWGASVGSDVEFDQPPPTDAYVVLGPSVGDDIPREPSSTF